MNFKCSGMRGDFIGIIHFLDYFPKEKHTVVLLNNPSLVSWPGHEHAGVSLNDKDIHDFNEILSIRDIECINREEAEKRGIDTVVDLDAWRSCVDLFNGDIMFSIAHSLGIKPSNDFKIDKTNGWLNKYVNDVEINNKIVINRTFRYRTNKFAYYELEQFKKECVFIGSDSEYDDFCKTYFNVERLVCNSLKDILYYIAGSKAFVGNHSMCMFIAVGLAKTRFIESHRSNIDNYTIGSTDYINSSLINQLYSE